MEHRFALDMGQSEAENVRRGSVRYICSDRFGKSVDYALTHGRRVCRVEILFNRFAERRGKGNAFGARS